MKHTTGTWAAAQHQPPKRITHTCTQAAAWGPSFLGKVMLKVPASLLVGGAGLGLQTVLEAVVQRIPPPQGNPTGDLRMLLFDAYHDEYR